MIWSWTYKNVRHVEHQSSLPIVKKCIIDNYFFVRFYSSAIWTFLKKLLITNSSLEAAHCKHFLMPSITHEPRSFNVSNLPILLMKNWKIWWSTKLEDAIKRTFDAITFIFFICIYHIYVKLKFGNSFVNNMTSSVNIQTKK